MNNDETRNDTETRPMTMNDQETNPSANGDPHSGDPATREDVKTPSTTSTDDAHGASYVQGALFDDGDRAPASNTVPVIPPGHDGNQSIVGQISQIPVKATVITVAASVLLSLGLGYAGVAAGIVTIPGSSSLSSITSSPSSSTVTTKDWTKVVSKVKASVVSITATTSSGSAEGSGAFIDKSGHIVTNWHVVDGATKITVTTADGKIYTAKIKGYDSTTDIAVITPTSTIEDVTPVTFADSGSVAVGSPIMSIGNPLGYSNSVTTGVVSAVNRPVSVTSDDSSQTTIVTNAIQIDSSINQGNSGGPTFNAAGEVVGINSSIATTSTTSSSTSSTGSIGIGFAIPSSLVKTVTTEILEKGSATHVQLGVTVKTGTATADGVTRNGATVVSVTSGSSAANAGVKTGDVIAGYNGKSIDSVYSLLGYVRAASYGDKATLTIVRDSKTITLTVTLNHKETTSTSSSSSSGSGSSNGYGDSSNDDDESDPYEFFR